MWYTVSIVMSIYSAWSDHLSILQTFAKADPNVKRLNKPIDYIANVS